MANLAFAWSVGTVKVTLGGVAFMPQLLGTLLGIVIALTGGFAIYGALRATVGIRLTPEEEFDGADIAIHRISTTPERDE